MKSTEEGPTIHHCTYIETPVSRVYETLTTSIGWDGWFTQGATVDLRPGGHIQFRWNNFGGGRWTTEDGGAVVDVELDTTFSFQWSPAGHPTTVTFTLKSLGLGTLVTLRETGYGSNIEDLNVALACAVGWGEALTLLKFYLEHGITYGQVPPG
ncbi:MAG TPA: SRPBCC domain-containing protein [Pyrinomonadaceae bacterium]